MTIDEKVRKTLAELGVTDARGVEALFAEVRATMEHEREELVSHGAANEAERNLACKRLRDRWLARKSGLISMIDERWLKCAAKEVKPAVGKAFNELRRVAGDMEVEGLISRVPIRLELHATDTFEMKESVSALVKSAAWLDLTLPGNRRPLGSIHPVTRVLREIEDIFINLGFRIETGPEIETVYYNFDALNIPETHPSRDDWDTIYVDNANQGLGVAGEKSEVRSQKSEEERPLTPDTGNLKPSLLLRTHTSPVQIRAMQKYGAPLYIIAPGKVYRHDNPDSSHATMFHQIEGLAVDRDITFADLKGTLDFFAKRFFGGKVRTSFHPSFFPFTEPSGEVAISCVICDGQGCRVCKESGWVEVMGCGMVHPEVLRNGGIDPSKFAGWAFGLGVERYAMMKYGINDIQLFYQSDLRFLEQF
jgi:phenylalanyl-tRNA synthetase alpha chain